MSALAIAIVLRLSESLDVKKRKKEKKKKSTNNILSIRIIELAFRVTLWVGAQMDFRTGNANFRNHDEY